MIHLSPILTMRPALLLTRQTLPSMGVTLTMGLPTVQNALMQQAINMTPV